MEEVLLVVVLVVHAVRQVGLQVLQRFKRGPAEFLELCCSDGKGPEPLEVPNSWPHQLQAPEITQPDFSFFPLFSTRVSSEEKVEAGFAVVDKLMGISWTGFYRLPGVPVCWTVLLVSVKAAPALVVHLVDPEAVADPGVKPPCILGPGWTWGAKRPESSTPTC